MCERNPNGYFKCQKCFAIFVTQINETFHHWADRIVKGVECGVCGGEDTIYAMGRIGIDRRTRVTDKVKCKCDGRCVHAVGPLCECMCGGANHGSGPAGYTKVEIIVGKAPRLSVLDEKVRAKHESIAKEFDDAIARVEAAANASPIVTLLKQYQNESNWEVKNRLYREMYEKADRYVVSNVMSAADYQFRMAKRGKSQKDRLKKLAKIEETIRTATESMTLKVANY